MYQLTAAYAHPENPTAFLEHYRSEHAPLARKLPGAQHFSWNVCETADGSRPPHFLVAVIRWENRDDALAALSSPEGEAAVADLAAFATAGVDINLGELHVEA